MTTLYKQKIEQPKPGVLHLIAGNLVYVALVLFVILLLWAFFSSALDNSIDIKNVNLCESAKISGNWKYQELCETYYVTGDFEYLRSTIK